MKKPNRQQQRQRQKVSKKNIVLICAASISCMAIGWTIFFYMSEVAPTKAGVSRYYMVKEQEFINDKNIAAPVTSVHPAMNNTTILTRQLKLIPETMKLQNQQ